MKYYLYCRKSSEDDERQALSIESQHREADRLIADLLQGTSVEAVDESMSAKAPGRPGFGRMMQAIERGEAQGIVSWDPDRLARNPVDGGWIIHLLDRGLIKDLRFATFRFDNSPQGKFMLGLMFGQAKYYVDALSANIRRGNRTKVEKGWLPSGAAPGYLNEPVLRIIVDDPDRFRRVEQMWRMLLSGMYSPRRIMEIANQEWGYRTRQRRRIGGKPLTLSMMYKIFANPFYAGVIRWEGKVYSGKHHAMITLDEFNRAQEILGRQLQRRAKARSFAYTGLIRCGACGLAVTAEAKVNRYGQHYTYYHCTRRRRSSMCREPSIEARNLEAQLATFLGEIELPPAFASFVSRQIESRLSDEQALHAERERGLKDNAKRLARELENLTTLRIRDLIQDEEFVRRKADLESERIGLGQRAAEGTKAAPLELLSEVIAVSTGLKNRFLGAGSNEKRLLVQLVGSNLSLQGQELSIDVRKPFRRWTAEADVPSMWSFMDDVRTFALEEDSQKLQAELKALKQLGIGSEAA